MSQQPVERTAAPGVANPASPQAPREARTFQGPTLDAREVLLRRALAADAPRWEQPPAGVLHFYARRARIYTGPILRVNGLMCIQVALPTAFVRELVN